jgi:hypothetical protein
MKSSKRVAVVLSLVLSAAGVMPYDLSSARPRVKRVHLIETGTFHGDEIAARTGQTWLGLYVAQSGAILRYSKLRVRSVFDEVIDYGTGRMTAKLVGVRSARNPVFLLSHATTLRAGPVTSLFRADPDFSKGVEKFPVRLSLRRKSYILKVTSADKTPSSCGDGNFPKNARLSLVTGSSLQTLYQIDGCGNDPSWFLLWAGDLDRDGKLDLYVSVTYHYDVSDHKLFLSSGTTKGKLVREVASFVTGGC